MIKTKEKPCKSTGIAKDFDGCGKNALFRNRGLCQKCYAKWLLTTDEGKKVLDKATLKATKKRREFESFEKETKENTSLSWLLKNTVIACHKYIRLRDKGKPCISCDEPYNPNHQAGHFYKAETFSTLKFLETNIHGQCVGCNIRKDGNESEYRVRIPKRIGEEDFIELELLAQKDKLIDHKWDREELVRIRDYYREAYKELTK